jgi:hypothetical protein
MRVKHFCWQTFVHGIWGEAEDVSRNLNTRLWKESRNDVAAALYSLCLESVALGPEVPGRFSIVVIPRDAIGENALLHSSQYEHTNLAEEPFKVEVLQIP